ncbi:MAG TPA: LLM class F420-dependent oxidoreductase [Blastocatellia bacterium]|nr:LLM class F420-dependent oxidoreductase [Blastocatellia bacterium]
MTKRIRFGVQTAPQHVTYEALREAWRLIDSAGYDTAWLFDHFFPILSDPSGPCYEGWTMLAALAGETSLAQIGILVTGNTYRHPAVLAKMGATVDHTSGGRLIMGIGAGWFEMEHAAYGIPFYTTAERIRRVDEACEVIKRLWSERQATFAGKYYQLVEAYCEPKPLQQPRPPLMIGGSGEQLMLRVIAKHADIWNTFGSPELFRHKLGVLQEHCAATGRNLDEIEVSWAGMTFITDSEEEKQTMIARGAAMFGAPIEAIAPGLLIGSPAEVRDRIHQFVEVGVTHFILIPHTPADHATIRRFAEEVMPAFRS